MNEWEWVELLRQRVPVTSTITGIGDDAAILPPPRGIPLITTDSFVEGIHFRPEWASWQRIGRKMAEAAISDIAAMGGRPTAMVVGLSVSSSSTPHAPEGLLEGFLACGVPLVGGDTTGARDGCMTVCVTVLGDSDRPVTRSGARPGDDVYVSGPLGGSRGGLTSLERGHGLVDLEARFLDPRARRDLAEPWGRVANAMIDISDGLASELHHLARESSVRIEIQGSDIPLWPGLEAIGTPLEIALQSGEEFELLATSSSSLPGGIRIGRVVAGTGVLCDDRPLVSAGYTHWS